MRDNISYRIQSFFCINSYGIFASVSCKLLGTWPNRTKVTVEVVATGEAKVATVRDANEFHLYDIFDAKDYGREIQWTAELNNATY